jgi:hypothetical protein
MIRELCYSRFVVVKIIDLSEADNFKPNKLQNVGSAEQHYFTLKPGSPGLELITSRTLCPASLAPRGAGLALDRTDQGDAPQGVRDRPRSECGVN